MKYEKTGIICRERYKNLKQQEKLISEEKEKVRNEFLITAEFNIGDRVQLAGETGCLTNRNTNPIGIVIKIYPRQSKYLDILDIRYVVGKIKKDGTVHKTATIHWEPIPEKVLKLMED